MRLPLDVGWHGGLVINSGAIDNESNY